MKSKKAKVKRKGSALLVVLFIVMAITILSLGFLSRSDVELACGENMILRTQMDYLAESGLEHARGLILNDSNYLGDWPERQLVEGSNDYYKVNVVYHSECNYVITCDAYRKKGVEKIGRSSLEAAMRLDPCIAFWTQTGTIVSSGVTIHGDVRCGGTLLNEGTMDGDVFILPNSFSGIEPIGKKYKVADLSLPWPRVTVNDFILHYSYSIIDTNTLDSNSLGGSSQVCYRNNDSDLKLASNVQIEGMLIVDANLTITGSGNVITAGEDLPAMLVTGDLIIESGGELNVYGLAVVVNGVVRIDGTANITGGLFVENGITGSGNMTITAAPSKTAIITWSDAGITERWGQASGAFFKSIRRL